MRVLFLSPRFPLPAITGDKLRAWGFLRQLSAVHQVTLLSYLTGDDESSRVPELEKVCRVVTVPFDLPRRALACARGIAMTRPFQCLFYESPEMKRRVAELAREADAIHCNTLRMAGNLARDCSLPLVVDFIDALSATYANRGTSDPARWLFRLEARRLACFERQLASRAALAMAVGAEDARILGEGVAVVPHAVDTETFCPPESNQDRRGLVFTGNLAYPPNVEAAIWLVHEVFPRIRAECPQATLRLVGARPARAVRALARGRVEVTGYVPSVADELRRASVALAPVRKGSGVKTKVLEAMACGAAVVAAPGANAGINAVHGKEILLAEEPDEFARQVITLVRDPGRADAMGRAGRLLAETWFSWRAVGPILLGHYEKLAKRGPSADTGDASL